MMCEFFITLYKHRHPSRSVAPFLSFCFKNKQEKRMRRRGRWRLSDRNPLERHGAAWIGVDLLPVCVEALIGKDWGVCVCLSGGCWCVSSWLLRAEQHNPAALPPAVYNQHDLTLAARRSTSWTSTMSLESLGSISNTKEKHFNVLMTHFQNWPEDVFSESPVGGSVLQCTCAFGLRFILI